MQKGHQLPHYIAFMILEESLFWFMMGKLNVIVNGDR